MRIYLTSSAEHRSKILSRVSTMSAEVVEHLIKIFIYPDKIEVEHWEQEVFAFLHQIPKIKSGKYPSKDSLMKNSWWVHEDSIFDVCKAVISEYGYEIDFSTVSEACNFCYNKIYLYFDWLTDCLSVRGRVNRNEVCNKIDELLRG